MEGSWRDEKGVQCGRQWRQLSGDAVLHGGGGAKGKATMARRHTLEMLHSGGVAERANLHAGFKRKVVSTQFWGGRSRGGSGGERHPRPWSRVY